VNEMTLQSPKQASSDTDSLENTSPEFLYIFHNLEAAERQMSSEACLSVSVYLI